VLLLASAPYALLPLGFSCDTEDCGDALCSPGELEACAWASGLALLPSSRPRVASRTSPSAPLQPNEMARFCMLLAAWSHVPKSHPTPMSFESHWKRSRWISRMWVPSRLNRARKASVSMWSKSAILWMLALRLPSLPRPERISTRHPALEAVITFLQKSGRPRQMTFDRDPLLSWEGCQVGIFPPHSAGSSCAWGLCHTFVRHTAPTKCLR
jgi:hypothetical protein